jgi:hemoglobin
MDTNSSLFEQLGGATAVEAAVDNFYGRVLADVRIRHFFEGVDMVRQRRMQAAFLTVAFGGPNHYTGAGLAKAHARLVADGLNDGHFDAVIENLAATLRELGIADGLIAQVAAIAESVRGDVLGRSAA